METSTPCHGVTCPCAGVALMSTIASQHGGADHEKASNFMSTTLEKV